MDTIYVIIPVFEGWTETQLCLDALQASTYQPIKIIVVNHGTNRDIREAVCTRYPQVLQVFGESTLWWAGATNLGIKKAMRLGAKQIMLLNHDCYVEPSMIGRLAAHIAAASESLIAPVPYDYRTKRVLAVTARTGFFLGFPMLAFPDKARYVGQPKLLRTKLILGGRGVLIPSAIFERIGLFDERNLPSYYADFDFFIRCRTRGIPLYIAADAKVYIDNTRTTLATGLGNLTFRQFLRTLRIPRSHRNVRDLTSIFRFHYPIKGFHLVGVALNVLRYCSIYALARLSRLFRR